jgi:hypothetical protein
MVGVLVWVSVQKTLTAFECRKWNRGSSETSTCPVAPSVTYSPLRLPRERCQEYRMSRRP